MLPSRHFHLPRPPRESAPDRLSNKNSAESPVMGRLPPLPRQSLSRLRASPGVPASPPCPPRPGPLCPPPQRGLNPSPDPGAPRRASSGPRAGSAGAGPERAARVRGCGASPRLCARGGQGAAAPRTCQASSQDRRRRNFRSPCRSGGPAPLPGGGARIPGRGLGGPGSSSAFPCSPPGAWPGPDSASARPCAPSHPRAHTLTLPRALAHALPSLLLFCLSPPAVWGPRRSPAPRLRHAVSAPPRAAQPAPTLRRERPAVPGMASRAPPPLAPGQRPLRAAPTNLLVGEPRPVATNPLCRSPDRQPVGGRESRAKPRSILGVVVFPLS